MKKNYLTYALCFAALLSGVALTSCGDTYDGAAIEGGGSDTDPDGPTDPGESEQEKLGIVRVTYTDPCYDGLATRGTGAFQNPWDQPNGTPDYEKFWGGWEENINGQNIYVNPLLGKNTWNSACFYIYAFNKSTELPRNDYATLFDPDEPKIATLLDGSQDGVQGYAQAPHGKLMKLNEDEGTSFFTFVKEDHGGSSADYNLGTNAQSGVNLMLMDDEKNVFKYDKAASDERFRFYGYYIDDARVSDFRRGEAPDGTQKQEVSFQLTIDGTQDIMSARSFDKMKEIENVINKNVTNLADREEVKGQLFGLHSGNRNIHPLLKFKHQLCYIQFLAVNAASKQQLDEGEGDIYLTGIDLQASNTGRFYVAYNDPDDNETPNYALDDDGLPIYDETLPYDPARPDMTWEPHVVWTPTGRLESVNKFTWREGDTYPFTKFFNMHLTHATPVLTTDAEGKVTGIERFEPAAVIGGDPAGLTSAADRRLMEDFYIKLPPGEADPASPDYKSEVYKRTPTRIGNMGIMLPPAEFYPMLVSLTQVLSRHDDGTVNKTHAYYVPYDLRLRDANGNPIAFEAGKLYTVRLAIYPDQKIETYVSVTNWKPGGSADVEPGTGFEDEDDWVR